MHRVYPMLFEAEKCTGWNRDSFFFLFPILVEK